MSIQNIILTVYRKSAFNEDITFYCLSAKNKHIRQKNNLV